MHINTHNAHTHTHTHTHTHRTSRSRSRSASTRLKPCSSTPARDSTCSCCCRAPPRPPRPPPPRLPPSSSLFDPAASLAAMIALPPARTQNPTQKHRTWTQHMGTHAHGAASCTRHPFIARCTHACALFSDSVMRAAMARCRISASRTTSSNRPTTPWNAAIARCAESSRELGSACVKQVSPQLRARRSLLRAQQQRQHSPPLPCARSASVDPGQPRCPHEIFP